MSNKQSSLEMMWDEIDNLFPFKDSIELQKFCAILDKYKAMHKEEIVDPHGVQYDYSYSQIDPKKVTGEQYYNETYG